MCTIRAGYILGVSVVIGLDWIGRCEAVGRCREDGLFSRLLFWMGHFIRFLFLFFFSSFFLALIALDIIAVTGRNRQHSNTQQIRSPTEGSTERETRRDENENEDEDETKETSWIIIEITIINHKPNGIEFEWEELKPRGKKVRVKPVHRQVSGLSLVSQKKVAAWLGLPLGASRIAGIEEFFSGTPSPRSVQYPIRLDHKFVEKQGSFQSRWR